MNGGRGRMRKVQKRLVGVRRKLDLYWGSPGERGNSRGLCSNDFTTLSLPGSFLVLLIKKPRPAASSRSH